MHQRNNVMDTNNISALAHLSATGNIVQDVRAILQEARRLTARAINSTMVTAYWLIGKRIVVEEQKGQDTAKYGEQILQKLSRELTTEFGNGFSYANLRNMRQFYRTYPNEQICYTLCSKLSWSHNRLIMRVEAPAAREWYLQETARENWSVRQLERNIQSYYYQRMLSVGRTIEQKTITKYAPDTKEFIKDPYVLEFVGLPPYSNYREKPLEDALVENMQEFLLELGKGFSFVKRQYRVSTETEHFYIDLVFYNYRSTTSNGVREIIRLSASCSVRTRKRLSSSNGKIGQTSSDMLELYAL